MSQSKTVLVVDDSRMSRMMILRIIGEHYPEWQVLEAGSGDEALEVCEGQDIDIMTLDMNMPGMNGLELGAQLRERFPDADISLVTANIQSAIKERARAAQIRFVPKPITEDRILSYIHSTLV
jgi:CheY-like chemotaxis protein